MKKTALIALICFFLGIFLASFVFVYLPEKNAPDSFLEEPWFLSRLSSCVSFCADEA